MALVVMLLALAAPLTAGWWKLQSGAITVYTDGAQSAGREALEKLDLARRVFSSLNGVSLPLPVEVFALTSEARFRALRPSQPVQGFYQSAAERDYIVLNMSAAERGRIVFHEYVHMVLNHTAGPLPAWLEEGLAEFHSTVEVAEGKVRLGKPIGNHLRLLAVRPWMAAGEMAGVTKDSPHFDEASRAGVFYAQSWALVHMLRMDEAYRGGFGEFLAAVGGGQAQAAALQKVYGKALPELIVDLKRYLDRTGLPVADYSVELESAAPVEAVELPALDSDLAYAGLANQCGRREEAEKIYRKYRKAKPDTARMATALAMIELASKRWEAARRLFEQAIAFPEAAAEAYFEYAMLLRDTAAAPRGEIRSLLQQAIGRNPRHAEAQFLLGAGYAAEGRHGEAIGHLEQALAVFPRQSYFWHALAVSYEASGRREDAMRAARRALDAATTVEQAEMARSLARSLEAPAAAEPVKRAAVNTPDSWKNKQGDAKVEGILERIECLGASARFHVRAKGKAYALLVEKPGEVLLKNFSSMTFEFRCGAQKPTAVTVEYFSATGIVTGVEFR